MSGTTWNPPSSPAVGELYQFAGATWSWNGSAWVNANTGEYFVTPSAMAAAIAAAPQVPQNYIDNSGFTVNQRGYTSGTALAAGTGGNVGYGFDRWKGGPASGGTLTFTASPASTIVTISAGSIQQVIEGLDLLSEPYTLSWAGTATGRISTTSGGGTYAASPIQFNATANTDTYIEFTGGTLGQVQLQIGTVATPWQPQPYVVEQQRCRRMFTTGRAGMQGYNASSGGNSIVSPLSPQMRTAPTIAITNQSTNGPVGVPIVVNADVDSVWLGAAGTGSAGIFTWWAQYTASSDL